MSRVSLLTPEEKRKRAVENQMRYCRRHPDRKLKARRRLLAKGYGLTLEEYEKLIQNPCEICGVKKNRMGIDHVLPGTFRGVLCIGCNWKLGWYEAQKTAIEAYLAGGGLSKQ